MNDAIPTIRIETPDGRSTVIDGSRMSFGTCIKCGTYGSLLDGVCGECDTSEDAAMIIELLFGATASVVEDEPGS